MFVARTVSDVSFLASARSLQAVQLLKLASLQPGGLEWLHNPIVANLFLLRIIRQIRRLWGFVAIAQNDRDMIKENI